ncbi:MAG: hypothetical protein M3O23_07655 [Actinomycetota bacterium]|nr:hypothetical protein [Actinomycetota bacterium]
MLFRTDRDLADRRRPLTEAGHNGASGPPAEGPSRWRPALRPEVAVLVAGLLPAVVVYGFHWRRGYFLDDPFMDALTRQEVIDSVVNMRARPLGSVLVGITYLIGEPAGRFLAAVVLAATAALAALLVRRVCGGRYAPVIAALLVVYPILDWESALYWYAAIQYPAGAAFGLAAGHLFLTTLRAGTRRSAVWSGLVCAALYVAALACTEVAINFLLLVPGLAVVEALRRKGFDRAGAIRLAGVLAGATVAVGALAAFIYLPENDFTSARGEFLLDPVEAASRIVNVWIPLLRNVAFSAGRARIHGEALSLGVQNLASPAVLAVFAAAVVAGGAALVAVVRSPPQGRRPDHRRAALGLVVVGIVLFSVSSWFPAGLLTGQGPVTRLLFTPWVALVLVVAGGVAALEAAGAARATRAAVAVVLVAVVPLALTLDGYGELFRLRHVRNQEQLAAWIAILEQAQPLPPDVRIVSLYGSDRLLPEPSPVDNTLAGLTETPWALSRMIYEQTGTWVFSVGGHPFVPVCIELAGEPAQVRVTSLFNDETVPADAVLAAEVHGHRLTVIDAVVFGSTVVEFPLAARVTSPAYEHLRLQADGEKVCRVYGEQVP